MELRCTCLLASILLAWVGWWLPSLDSWLAHHSCITLVLYPLFRRFLPVLSHLTHLTLLSQIPPLPPPPPPPFRLLLSWFQIVWLWYGFELNFFSHLCLYLDTFFISWRFTTIPFFFLSTVNNLLWSDQTPAVSIVLLFLFFSFHFFFISPGVLFEFVLIYELFPIYIYIYLVHHYEWKIDHHTYTAEVIL